MQCDGHQCEARWCDQKRVILLAHNTYARGLTKVLATAFSPDFSARTILRTQCVSRPKQHGLAVGNLVDNELSRWVANVEYSGTALFGAVQQYCRQRGWRPLASQVALGCAQLRLGTRLDLLCLDHLNRLILIELKTGFDDYFRKYASRLQPPFQDMPASCYTKACLQLLCTTWLFLHRRPDAYRDHVFGGAYVLQVDHAFQVQSYALPKWTCDSTRLAGMYQCLFSSRFESQALRNRALRNGAQRARRKAQKCSREKRKKWVARKSPDPTPQKRYRARVTARV